MDKPIKERPAFHHLGLAGIPASRYITGHFTEAREDVEGFS